MSFSSLISQKPSEIQTLLAKYSLFFILTYMFYHVFWKSAIFEVRTCFMMSFYCGLIHLICNYFGMCERGRPIAIRKIWGVGFQGHGGNSLHGFEIHGSSTWRKKSWTSEKEKKAWKKTYRNAKKRLWPLLRMLILVIEYGYNLPGAWFLDPICSGLCGKLLKPWIAQKIFTS